MASRQIWIGGNWKCNGTQAKVKDLVDMLNGAADQVPEGCEVVVSPVALHIPIVQSELNARYAVACQNIGKSSKQGAFTGDICADQIVDFGLRWTLVGHSERRSLSGETDEDVAAKVRVALDAGVKAVLCIGEQLAEREANETEAVIFRQLDAVKAVVPDEAEWANIVIAYEPVWAIGTGVVATPEQAQEAHAAIREKWLADKVGETAAASTRIVYGGSVKGANCEALIALPDVDGFLVGGASLKDDFLNIIASAKL